MKLLCTTLIEQSVTEHLSLALVTLLNAGGSEELFKTLVLSIKDALLVAEANKRCFKAVLTCLNSVLKTLITHATLLPFIADLLSYIEVFISKVVKGLNEEVGEIGWKVETIIVWTKLSIGLFNDAKLKSIPILEHYIYSQNVASIVQHSLQFLLAPTTQSPSIISKTENEEVDKLLNKMKNKTFDMIDVIVDYVYGSKFGKETTATAFFGLLSNVLPLAFNDLIWVCTENYDALEQTLECECTKQLISNLLKFLSNALSESKLVPFLDSNKSRLIAEVILVLLRATREERTQLAEDPQEFVSLALDTCESHTSETPKTEAAKLLARLCGRVEGSLHFAATFCCEAVRYSCAGQGEGEFKFVYGDGSLFLGRSSKEEVVETCLLALSVVSELVSLKKDLLAMFENLLLKFYPAIFESSSLIVNCRVALMLRYYAKALFQQHHGSFIKSIELLLKGLLCEDKHKALAVQCADTFKAIITEDDIVDRVEAFVNRLLPHFASAVAVQNMPEFFDMLVSVLQYYSEAIDAKIVPLFNALMLRLQSELAALKAGNHKATAVISQCWNAINCIYETDAFHPVYTEAFERSLVPAFSLLADSRKLEFEDDLVQIAATAVRKRKDVSDNMAKAFPLLVKYFEKSKLSLDNILEVLNYYLFYGKAQFAERKDWIEAVLQMAEAALFTEEKSGEANNVEAAILLQIALQTLGAGVMDSYIPGIMSLVLKRLDSVLVAEELAAQLYNVFLCAVCNNTPLTLRLVEPKLDWLMTNILNMRKQCKGSYNTKVLVIGLVNILLHGNMPAFADKYYVRILDTVLIVLQLREAKCNADLDAAELDDASEESKGEFEALSNEDVKAYVMHSTRKCLATKMSKKEKSRSDW